MQFHKVYEFIKDLNSVQRELYINDDVVKHYIDFLAKPIISIDDLSDFALKLSPEATLRAIPGKNVYNWLQIHAPFGGVEVYVALEKILDNINKNAVEPHNAYLEFMSLMPFMALNHTIGMLLWGHQMHLRHDRYLGGGFLVGFHYQVLEERVRKDAAERQD